jgi:hypothetical protein
MKAKHIGQATPQLHSDNEMQDDTRTPSPKQGFKCQHDPNIINFHIHPGKAWGHKGELFVQLPRLALQTKSLQLTARVVAARKKRTMPERSTPQRSVRDIAITCTC